MVETLNRQLFNEAKRYIPGGANSPVRSFKAVGGYPVFISRAYGSKLYGEYGREFIDYCLSWGAMILGHTHPKVTQALQQAIQKGTSFGAATKLETELAKLIVETIPSIEQVRLTNSGTEAVMSAIRLARAYTKRNKIIKFAGSYHGHVDYLLDYERIPKDFTKHTLVSPYNNIKRLEEIVRKHKEDIAAIIVEPVAANMGVVLPQDSFLVELRKITKNYKIVLIFDEVITGFRLTFGGAQKLFDVKPDLTCLGKIIGGGLPIGAFGGKRGIMKLLAPEGDVYQAGTFSGNPVSVNAGLTTLRILSKHNPYRNLGELTRYFCKKVKQIAKEDRIKVKINFVGSMFSIFFTGREVTDYNIARTQNTNLFKRFYHELLKEGIYFSPSGLEANFLSTAHTAEDIEKTLEAVDKVLKNLRG
jgi:glutamate-1-semialdehyde 2,1-aminomutase